MAKRKKAAKTEKTGWIDDSGFSNSPFATLGGAATPAAAPTPDPAPTEPLEPSSAEVRVTPKRAVIRLERRGRAGKSATVVSHLGISTVAAERLLREMRRHLGCGGGVEDGQLILQGEQRKRAADWLRQRGVKRVTVS